MEFSNIKAITIPEGNVSKIELNGVILWQAAPAETYKNWVKYSTESDGVTIYNGGLGYKDGYRIRSGGAESESSNTTITGFIPFKQGDILRIIPAFSGENTKNAINFFAGSTNFGQVTHSGSLYGSCTNANGWSQANIFSEEDDVTVLDISKVTNGDGITHVRITHFINSGVLDSGSGISVTVNEEITL